MSQLPVAQLFPQLLAELPTRQNFIVGAPPGAGKSTALPLALLESGLLEGMIVLLEPRRLAAKSIAQYLASCLGERVGQRVGYQMRGERKRSADTQLLIVTEGMLTRMLQADPELADVSLIIFDEFHERSLHAELGLALALEVQQGFNEQLKLMVMSATLETEPLQALLPEALVLHSEGRSYPIEYHYQPLARDRDWLNNVSQALLNIAEREQGSILVFLPGAREIRFVEQALNNRLSPDLELHSLYGQMELSKQQAAIAPAKQGQRKLVLSTNVAETSLTIEGITCVVDSGYERQADFHARSGTTRLSTRMICKSSAIQRAGRAGRLSAGRCYRLFSEEQFNHRPFAAEPEITRSDLSQLQLELLKWGGSAEELVWLQAPPRAHLAQASQLLRSLGLVDENHTLQATDELGLSPRFAAMLQQAQAWDSEQRGVLWRACELAAYFESANQRADSLHIEQNRQNLKPAARAQYQQLLKRLTQHFSAQASELEERWDGVLLAQAFPDRISQQRGKGTYTLAIGAGVQLEPQHALAKQSTLLVADLFWPEGKQQGIVSQACGLDLVLLKQLQPQRFSWQQRCYWSEKAQKLVAERCLELEGLVLQREPGASIVPEQVEQAWLARLEEQGLAGLPVNETALAWLERARCAAEWFSEQDWPSLDESNLLAQAEIWLLPHVRDCRSLAQLKKLDWLGMLQTLFSWQELQMLDKLAPSHYLVPSGNKVKIHYQLGQAPWISLKLQQMFGEPVSPKLGQRIPLVLELLSPAGRPLQRTQDLASFWQSAYPEVKKEMKGRYPKHPWPDDPTQAVATSKTKRQLAKK